MFSKRNNSTVQNQDNLVEREIWRQQQNGSGLAVTGGSMFTSPKAATMPASKNQSGSRFYARNVVDRSKTQMEIDPNQQTGPLSTILTGN